MPTVLASVEVAAPPYIVWELIADPSRHTEFGTFVSEVQLASPTPIGRGTVYHETSGPGFMKSRSQWTIIEFEPPNRLVHEGKEPSMHSRFAWTLEELGPTSTRLSQAGEFVMMPGLRPLGRVLEVVAGRRMLERETHRMLEDIKRIAEAKPRIPTDSAKLPNFPRNGLEDRVMAKFDVSTTIKRPVEDVFAVMSNVENNPKWSSVALEAEQTSPGPIGVGTTARFVGKVLGRRIESDFEVTEFEPNRKFASQTKSGPFPLQVSVTFEPIEGGTRVNTTIEGEPGGFFKLAEPLVVSVSKRQSQSDLDNLKDLMEANAL